MRIGRRPATIAIVFATLVAARPGAAQKDQLPFLGRAGKFVDLKGKPVGTASLYEMPGGVLVNIVLNGLPPGRHGMHIHEKGVCEPPFASAGGHVDFHNHGHGYLAGNGPHAGDMPNVIVAADGTAKVEVFVPGVWTKPDNPLTLSDADGFSIVVHADADDYMTNPAGNSGDRIACAAFPSTPPTTTTTK